MKIFCIGRRKTGTTNLLEALRILGDAAVHRSATKRAFRYTDDGGIDIDWDFFERHDAFADTVIARIYAPLGPYSRRIAARGSYQAAEQLRSAGTAR